MAQAGRPPKVVAEEKTESELVICLNERRHNILVFDAMLGFNPPITLKARTLEKNEFGMMDIVGDPTYTVKPEDLEVQFEGYPSQEKNPLRIAILTGDVFVTQGSVDLTPLIDVSREYDKHTTFLDLEKRKKPDHKEVEETKAITDGIKLEASDLLTYTHRNLIRALGPRVNNSKGKVLEDLISLLNCMLVLELDGENRPDFMKYIKDSLSKIDPNRKFLFEMSA